MVQEDAELAYRLIELRAYIDDLELEFSQLAAEFEKSRHWEFQGLNSAIDWLRFHGHMTSNAAADRVAVGNHTAEMPESPQDMRNGDIGFAHPTVMARTANAVGEAFSERPLLDLAARARLASFTTSACTTGTPSTPRSTPPNRTSWPTDHHIVFWMHGGGDELDNLVVLCRRHHRMVHEGGWQLVKSEDRGIITIAPATAFGMPRGPD